MAIGGQSSGVSNYCATYKAQQIMSARPEELVLILFDCVIQGCKQGEAKRASAALAGLIDSLDFGAGEIAAGLFRLYEYALREVKQSRFDAVLSVIEPLRETWATAIRRGVEPAVSRSAAVGMQ